MMTNQYRNGWNDFAEIWAETATTKIAINKALLSAYLQRHRHGVPAGLSKGGRGNFDHPKRQRDFRNLAQGVFRIHRLPSVRVPLLPTAEGHGISSGPCRKSEADNTSLAIKTSKGSEFHAADSLADARRAILDGALPRQHLRRKHGRFLCARPWPGTHHRTAVPGVGASSSSS